MNPRDNNSWEVQLDRALKGLPELPAPANLVERTLTELHRRQKPTLAQKPWTQWPLWLRAVSLTGMLALLGGACFVKWEFAHTAFGARLSQRLSDQFSNWSVVLDTMDTLARAAVTVARHLNPWIAALCIVVVVSAYFACIGLGTAAARLAFSRR